MSQSPETNDIAAHQDRFAAYQKGWTALNEMLSQGGSLSGRERNCCFLNLGSGAGDNGFVDISAVSGVDFADDARGLAMIDWDRDGDLDIWVTNRTSPRVRFLRNNLPREKHFLAIKLEGVHCNRDAIGARVELELENAPYRKLMRTLHAGESYLSQTSKWLHFGLGTSDNIRKLVVRWPGSGQAEEIKGVRVDGYYRIVQGSGIASQVDLTPVSITDQTVAMPAADHDGTARMVVASRVPLPRFEFDISTKEFGQQFPIPGTPTLLNLWLESCTPCVDEFVEWTSRRREIESAGLDIVALTPSSSESHQLMNRIGFPFRWGAISHDNVELIECLLGTLNDDYKRPIAVPLSLLLDRHGQVAVVYRGRVHVDQLLLDLELLQVSSEEVRDHITPLSGRWHGTFHRRKPLRIAARLKQSGKLHAAESYLRYLVDLPAHSGTQQDSMESTWRGEAAFALGSLLIEQGRWPESVTANRTAMRWLPRDYRPYANVGSALLKMGRARVAVKFLTQALELAPERDTILVTRATAYLRENNVVAALSDVEAALRIAPLNHEARRTAAALSFRQGLDSRAVAHHRALLDADPGSVDAIGALAWILATSGDPSIRDGREALRLAEIWCERTGMIEPKALNTLAAAYAELGNFEAAIGHITTAIELARQQDVDQLVETYLQRRSIYRNRQPIRRPFVSDG